VSAGEREAEAVLGVGAAPKRILVAGIGNAWMKDDAFGGKVAERLTGGALPEQAAVFDFGTGGLDLAYEVMRGYDALVLIDISRQGGEPGTLYVMDAEPDDLEPIADGEMLSPHGMDPETVLRFVKAVGGWPGRVRIVACEPAVVEEMGLEMSPAVQAAVERATDVVKETVAELLTDEAYAGSAEQAEGAAVDAAGRERSEDADA
jgi:hydrogenase maturation protease